MPAKTQPAKALGNPPYARAPGARDGAASLPGDLLPGDLLSREIRRQFGSAGVTRFLHSLPVFEVDQTMPQRFETLLAELERVEAEQSAPRAKS